MRKKIILICVFFSLCSVLLLANCIMTPSQKIPNFGAFLNKNDGATQSSDSGPYPYEPPDALINVYVKRTVKFSQDLTYVYDFFSVKNNKTNPKDYVQVGLKYELRNQLYYISANTESNQFITIQELPYDGSGYSKWNLYLNSPILPQDTFNFTLSMTFGDVIDFSNPTSYDGSNPIYQFSFYKYPCSPYYTETLKGRFINAIDSSEYSAFDISPWTYQSHSGTMKVTSAILECEIFQQEIEIERWGYIYVREYYQIKNIVDTKTAELFSVLVPADALKIKVYDFLTDLIITKIPDPAHLSFNITINWKMSRYPLGKNQKAFFYVEYIRPLELHTFEVGDIAKFMYQFEPQKLPWKADQFWVTFKLPAASSIITQLPTANSIVTLDGQIYLNYQYQNCTSQNYILYMFDYSVLNTLPFDFYRPLLIAFLISIPLISLIILKRELPRKKELRLRPTEVPSHIIREFITLYSEKNALYIEIEKLEENLTRRKIKKREYRNQLKNIEKKISDLNKELKTFQDQILEAGGRYTKIIEELELREADRDMSREALEAIERRYRISRRISTATYRKLKKEEEKALAKAKNSIEKLIQELRELMG
ncbi:MAG: hypothetical protein ACTSR3_02450 [Candidatus Helarchaeota archaeon]